MFTNFNIKNSKICKQTLTHYFFFYIRHITESEYLIKKNQFYEENRANAIEHGPNRRVYS
jgi:hypothetical protein